MVNLELVGLTKTYDSPPITAVEPTDLEIDHGDFFTLVGPSGCGKTTLLRMIAGLETPTAGDIYFDGEKVTDLPPQQRNAAMVFQNIALYPHMTCHENIGYGLRARGDTENYDQRIQEAAELLDIKEQLQKKPAQLSGGQQQRVALGRAIVRDPNLILLDEPMSDLDAKLKAKIRIVIQELHEELDTTMIYVTHDQKEAMTMSTQVGLLNNGSFEQIDPPDRMYDHPKSVFAGEFIGQPSMNFLDVTVDGDDVLIFDKSDSSKRGVKLPDGAIDHDKLPEGGNLIAGFRPQDISVTESVNDSLVDFTYKFYEQDANEFYVYMESEAEEEFIGVEYRKPDFERGSKIGIEEIQRLFLFDPSDERILFEINSPLCADESLEGTQKV